MNAPCRFGRFELRPTERQLVDGTTPVALGGRAIDVLLALVARAGHLVTKDELLDAAWPGLVVEEANVHVQVSLLRKALGREAIATVAGLGYRFALPLLEGASAAVPHNLPADRTPFVGRSAALAEAEAALAATRLLTLVGIGGSGKTRLALRLAERALPQHPGGVWFVDLAPLDTAEQLPLAVARVLGVAQRLGEPLPQTIAARLREQTALLLLDNCEHLLGAVAELVPTLLQAGAGVHVLCTSREALGLADERTLPVRPLAVPPATASADEAAGSESVLLFVDRAQQSAPGALAEPAALAVAAEICRRLDGIPLALELAAARLKLLSPQQLLDRLDERLRLLTGGQRAMPRQQTLLTVIQWSYENLSPEAQRLLRALSVCGGGCDLETAAALMGDGADDVAVLEPLSVLVDKGLVAVDRATTEMRYTSLETVRQYALQRLGESGEAAAVRDRHRDHFLAVAEMGEEAIRGVNPALWMNRMDRDRDNVLRALAWSDSPQGASAGLQLVTLMRHYFSSRGLLVLGRELHERALRRPEVPTVDRVHCLALSSLAQLCGWMGDMAQARRHAEAAYRMACELGDLRSMSRTVGQLGRIDATQGDFSTARRRIDESMVLARQAGEPHEIVMALGVRANLHWEEGELQAARTLYAETLTLRRRQGLDFIWPTAMVVLNLSAIDTALGDLTSAREQLVLGLEMQRRTGSRYLGQYVIEGAAALALRLGSPALGLRWYAASTAQREAIRLTRDEAALERHEQERALGRAALDASAADAAEIEGATLGYEVVFDEAAAWLTAAR